MECQIDQVMFGSFDQLQTLLFAAGASGGGEGVQLALIALLYCTKKGNSATDLFVFSACVFKLYSSAPTLLLPSLMRRIRFPRQMCEFNHRGVIKLMLIANLSFLIEKVNLRVVFPKYHDLIMRDTKWLMTHD